LLILVPQCERGAFQTLQEREATDARELRIVAQAIERDSARQMVHVMHADIASEPGQDARQLIVRAAVKRGFVKAPIAVVRPKRVLELMLDIEEPHRDRAADRHDRRLHEKEGPEANQPDH